MARSRMIALMDYTDGLSDASKETDDKEQKEILDEIDEDKKSLSLGVEWMGSNVGYEDFKDTATKFFDTVMNFFKSLFSQITTLVVSDLKTINAAIERWDKLKKDIKVTEPYELEIAKDGKACFSFAGLDWLSKRAPILFELQKAMSVASPDIEKSIQELPDTSTTDETIAKVQAGSEQVVTQVSMMYDGLNKAVAGKWFDDDNEVFPRLRYKKAGNGLPTLQVPTGKEDNTKITKVNLAHYFAAGTKSNIEITYIEKELNTHKAFLEITNKVCADLKRIIESSSKDLAKVKKLFLSLQSQTRTKNQEEAQGTASPTTPNPAQGKTGYVGLEGVRTDANDKNAAGQRAGAKLLACVKSWQRPAQLICTCCQKTIGDLRVSYKVASAAMDHFSGGTKKEDEKKEETTTTTTPQQGKTASMDDLLQLTPMARHMTLALGGSYLVQESEEEDSVTLVWKEIEHYFDIQSNDLRPGTEGFLDSIIEFFAGFFKAIGTFFDRLFGGGSGGGGGGGSSQTTKAAQNLKKTAQTFASTWESLRSQISNLQNVTWAEVDPKGFLTIGSLCTLEKLIDADVQVPLKAYILDGEAYIQELAKASDLLGKLIPNSRDLGTSTMVQDPLEEYQRFMEELITRSDAGGAARRHNYKVFEKTTQSSMIGDAKVHKEVVRLKFKREMVEQALGNNRFYTGNVDALLASIIDDITSNSPNAPQVIADRLENESKQRGIQALKIKRATDKLEGEVNTLMKKIDNTLNTQTGTASLDILGGLEGKKNRKKKQQQQQQSTGTSTGSQQTNQQSTGSSTARRDLLKKIYEFRSICQFFYSGVLQFFLQSNKAYGYLVGQWIRLIKAAPKIVALAKSKASSTTTGTTTSPSVGTASLDYPLYATEELFGYEDCSLLDPQTYDFFEVEVGLEDGDDDKEFFLIRWIKWIWKKITGFFDWLFGSSDNDKKAVDKVGDIEEKAKTNLKNAVRNLDKLPDLSDHKKLTLPKGCLTPEGIKRAEVLLDQVLKNLDSSELKNKLDDSAKLVENASAILLKEVKSYNDYETMVTEISKIEDQINQALEPLVGGTLTANKQKNQKKAVTNTRHGNPADVATVSSTILDIQALATQAKFTWQHDVTFSSAANVHKDNQGNDVQTADAKILEQYANDVGVIKSKIGPIAKSEFERLGQRFSSFKDTISNALKKVEGFKINDNIIDEGSKPVDGEDDKQKNARIKAHRQNAATTVRKPITKFQKLLTNLMKAMQEAVGRKKKSAQSLFTRIYKTYIHLNQIAIEVAELTKQKGEAAAAKQKAANDAADAKQKKKEESKKKHDEWVKKQQEAQQQGQQGQPTAWFEPGLLYDDVYQFEFALESFKGIGTEGILDSVLGLLTGLANMVSRLFSTFKMIYRSFKDLKRTELHSYQEKYPASIFRVKRLSYQELSDVDVPLPKGLKTTYQDALQKTLTVLRACDMKARSKAFVSVAKKLVSQLKTGIDTRTTTGGLYTQEQEVKQINNLFKKADQCFDGASATSKKFKSLFTSTEEFSTVHDLLDDGCQYEYEVASVYSNLQECEELMNEAVAHAKSRKSLGNIPISKAELVNLSETCLFMAKTFDMYGLAVANFNKIEHNYVETLKAIMRKFDI